MYTYEKLVDDEGFHILDPDDTVIATVKTIQEAEGLVSHLNR